MKPITYKFVMDGKGNLGGVELWQNDQHITISFEHPGQTPSGYKWKEVKDFLDEIKLPSYEDKKSIVIKPALNLEGDGK